MQIRTHDIGTQGKGTGGHRATGSSNLIQFMVIIAQLLFGCCAASAQPETDRGYLFQFQPVTVGQQIWQHVTMFANLTTTLEQSGQKISQTNQMVTREQIRRLVVLENQANDTSKVRVHYEKASESVLERGREPDVQDQPVLNKSYIVWREAGKLVVRGEDGTQPTNEEDAIVRQNMQAVGRANPLASYLHGRWLQMGERIELPPELAADLLGWKSEFGGLERVELTLKKITNRGGTQAGIFQTVMTGAPSSGNSQTRMSGQLAVELSTCRTISVDMQADLVTREERGPQGGTFFVSNRGQATIHTQARFLNH